MERELFQIGLPKRKTIRETAYTTDLKGTEAHGCQEEHPKLPFGGLEEEEKNVALVLIISSMPRSGSTLFGTTLATFHPSSVYFFEPLYYMRTCFDGFSCPKYLEQLFTCNIEDDFEQWLRFEKPQFFKFFNSRSRFCSHKRRSPSKCLNPFDLKKECREASLRIIKLIRMRLSEVEGLLQSFSSNFKVIHLIRDPRGSLFSIQKFRDMVRPLGERCSELLDDLRAFHSLSRKYPNKIIQISFEQFARDPWKTTKFIYSFIYNSNNQSSNVIKDSFNSIESHLPQSTQLHLHMLHPKQSELFSRSTVLNDITENYQDWRMKISSKRLKAIESNKKCKESLDMMSHKFLKTESNVKNESFPLF